MRYAVFVVSLLLTTACAKLGPGPPPVDADFLAEVIADLHLAQALSDQVPVVLRDSMEVVYFDKVLADYDLTRPEFDSLMWIVRREPAWIDTVYTRAGVRVSRDLVE